MKSPDSVEISNYYWHFHRTRTKKTPHNSYGNTKDPE